MYLSLEISLNKGKDMRLDSMQTVYALAKEYSNYKMNGDGREKS